MDPGNSGSNPNPDQSAAQSGGYRQLQYGGAAKKEEANAEVEANAEDAANLEEGETKAKGAANTSASGGLQYIEDTSSITVTKDGDGENYTINIEGLQGEPGDDPKTVKVNNEDIEFVKTKSGFEGKTKLPGDSNEISIASVDIKDLPEKISKPDTGESPNNSENEIKENKGEGNTGKENEGKENEGEGTKVTGNGAEGNKRPTVLPQVIHLQSNAGDGYGYSVWYEYESWDDAGNKLS